MNNTTGTINRSKLVDQPIVEMLLSRKFAKSNISFIKSGTDNGLTCFVNGTKRNIDIRRNSAKHFSSPNFTISLDKNKLHVFNNTSFVFIDEVADSLYMIDGTRLLSYILEHSEELIVSENNPKVSWILLPKKNLINLIGDNHNSIIHYNKQVANLFKLNRNEDQYKGV